MMGVKSFLGIALSLLLCGGCRKEHDESVIFYQHPYPNNPEFATTLGTKLNENAFAAAEVSAGLAVAGYTQRAGAGGRDALIALFDGAGNPLWCKVIGGLGDDVAHSITRTPDGGFAVAGWTSGRGGSDALLARFDSSGNPLWAKTIGGTEDEAIREIASLGDGFVVAGLSRSEMSSKALLARLDAGGNPVWAETIGGEEAYEARSVAVLPTGRIAICGIVGDYSNADINAFCAVFDTCGRFLWARALGDRGARLFDQAARIIPGPGNTVIVSGDTRGFSSEGTDIFLFSLDSAGNLLWAKALGGNDDDRSSSAVPVSGGFVLGGYTFSFGLRRCQTLISLFDSAGNRGWTYTAGWVGGDWCYGMTRTAGGFILVGRTWSFGAGGYDLLVLRFSPDHASDKALISSQNPILRDVEPSVVSLEPDVLPCALRVLEHDLKPRDLRPEPLK